MLDMQLKRYVYTDVFLILFECFAYNYIGVFQAKQAGSVCVLHDSNPLNKKPKEEL